MSRAVWLADVLTDAGLKIKPWSGWETRGANDFIPMGVMWHHTATKPTSSDSSVDNMLATGGNSDTPPPLCNYSTNRDGTVSIIAAGTANHAGVGSWHGITAVAGVNGDDGNERFFGDEMKNLGTSAEPWPAAQLESARIAAAAILNYLETDASWLCAHKEWAPGRKPDPHTLNMSTERGNVAGIMEDDMTPEQAAQLNSVFTILTAPLLNNPDNPTAPQTWLRTYNTISVLQSGEVTDADIAALAADLKATLPPATVAALAAELTD